MWAVVQYKFTACPHVSVDIRHGNYWQNEISGENNDMLL